jgi:transposase
MAVDGVLAGLSVEEVAEFADVEARSVYRWLACYRLGGPKGLAARPVSGRPAKLTAAEADRICQWLAVDPQAFGFVGSCWTAPRLAMLMARDLGLEVHPRYLNDWLRRHGISPQIPARVAREKDQPAIDRWIKHGWPRIKKTPRPAGRCWVSVTKAAF